MVRKHDNTMPGDLADESGRNLPGGMGTDDPDLNPDATIDELFGNDVISPSGEIISAVDSGGTTSGTGYATGDNTGATVSDEELQGET
jgi:hypothetical protein